MDWKQFIASVVGSLAWPSVIIVLLFLLRRQLAGLAERLQELSLPGGAKATFEKNLAGARRDAEKIAPEPDDATRIIPEGEERRFQRLAQEFPEAAIIERFKYIEGLLFRVAEYLDLKGQKHPINAIEELHRQGLIDEPTRDLFYRLRNARNAAAHVSQEAKITPGEALDFAEHADKLSARLAYLIGYLGSKAERKDPAKEPG